MQQALASVYNVPVDWPNVHLSSSTYHPEEPGVVDVAVVVEAVVDVVEVVVV